MAEKTSELSVTDWKARYDALRAETTADAIAEKQHRAQIKAQSRRRSRHTPSAAVMRHILETRIPHARDRAAAPAAVARHQQFVLRAPEYERARALRASLPAEARPIMLDGLSWWIPAPPSRSAQAIERTLLKQNIPYRAVAQTRDVALGDIMLDIGANIGHMAIPRVVLGDFRRVYCVEPDPLNYRCLVANVVDNGLEGLVLPDRLAISDHAGQVSMARGKMHGAHRVVHEPAADAATDAPCLTLDAWVEHHGIELADVAFVKMDTQGSEMRVLSGAARVLAQPQIAWQIEVAPYLLRLAGNDPGALYQLLQAHFTHFIDLNVDAEGPRLRSMADLLPAVAYLDREPDAHTDLLVYRAPAGARLHDDD